MPITVTFAVVLQLLLAATFVVLPVAVWLCGGAAQQAAEAETVRQGVPGAALAEHRIALKEKAWEFWLAMGIAATLAALGGLNIAGHRAGLVLSWVLFRFGLVAVGSPLVIVLLALPSARAYFG